MVVGGKLMYHRTEFFLEKWCLQRVWISNCLGIMNGRRWACSDFLHFNQEQGELRHFAWLWSCCFLLTRRPSSFVKYGRLLLGEMTIQTYNRREKIMPLEPGCVNIFFWEKWWRDALQRTVGTLKVSSVIELDFPTREPRVSWGKIQWHKDTVVVWPFNVSQEVRVVSSVR